MKPKKTTVKSVIMTLAVLAAIKLIKGGVAGTKAADLAGKAF